MTPAHGARDDAAVALGLGGGERGLRRLVLRLQIDELEPRHGVELDQPALGVEFDLALLDQRPGLRHLRLARLVGQHGDHVALFNAAAAAHAQLGQARRRCGPSA